MIYNGYIKILKFTMKTIYEMVKIYNENYLYNRNGKHGNEMINIVKKTIYNGMVLQ